VKSIHARAGVKVLTLMAAAALVFGQSAPAAADTGPLKRSVENLTQFPLDIALSPVTAATTVVNNIQTIEDSDGVRVFWAIPGYAWNVLANFGAGILRGMTGLIELPVGIGLAFFPDIEFDPLFPPVDDSDALVEYDEWEFYRIKFGVEYTGGG
jgi:hypothetical protein